MRHTISLLMLHRLARDIEAENFEFCNEDDGYNTCYASYDKNGQVTERGCSTKNNICDDLTSSELAYGFPVSRGCRDKEKISVKTRDCENRLEEGTFRRVCYCRKRLCNIGYDPLLELTGGVRYQYKPGVSATTSVSPLWGVTGLSWMAMCLL